MVEWGPICPSPPRNLYCHHYDLGIWWYGRGLVAAKYYLPYLNDFLKSERNGRTTSGMATSTRPSPRLPPPSNALLLAVASKCGGGLSPDVWKRTTWLDMIFQGFSDCRDIFHLYNMREKTYIANQFLRMCLSNGCLDRSFTALNKSSAAMQQIQQSFWSKIEESNKCSARNISSGKS